MKETGFRGKGEPQAFEGGWLEQEGDWVGDGYETSPLQFTGPSERRDRAPELPTPNGDSGHLGTSHPPPKEAQLSACPTWCEETPTPPPPAFREPT